MKTGFISGTSILHSAVFAGWPERVVETPFGAVTLRERGGVVVLNRHGAGAAPLPPHAINHRANLRALADAGCREVLALCSVGSLREDLPPGSLVVCEDYVALQQGPATYHDTELKGGAPGIANTLAPRLQAALAPEFVFVGGQIYVQMRGPRFETKAEIRVIREWGDVVGMTGAHEADLCTELGLDYTLLGVVDNHANGLVGTAIDFESFRELVRTNQARVDRLCARLVQVLGGEA